MEQQYVLLDLSWQRDDDSYWQTEIDWSLNKLTLAMSRHLNDWLPIAVPQRIGNVRKQMTFNRWRRTSYTGIIFGFGIFGCGRSCSGIISRDFIITSGITRCRGFTTRASRAAAATFIFWFSIWQTIERIHLTEKQPVIRTSHPNTLISWMPKPMKTILSWRTT